MKFQQNLGILIKKCVGGKHLCGAWSKLSLAKAIVKTDVMNEKERDF